jgi:hypothetical protein
VEHRYEKGHTLLLGTMAGAGYFAHADDSGGRPDAAGFFASLLEFGDPPQKQDVVSSDTRIKTRVHAGAGGRYLWIANPTRQAVPVQLTLRDRLGTFSKTRTVWGAQASCAGRTVELTAPARDVTVLELE